MQRIHERSRSNGAAVVCFNLLHLSFLPGKCQREYYLNQQTFYGILMESQNVLLTSYVTAS